MKIYCKCGNIISDSTDNIPYKAHIITDQNYHVFWQEIDTMIEDAIEQCLYRLYAHAQLAYQCTCCGRLYIDDGSPQLYEFIPTGTTKTNIFQKNNLP